MTSLAGIQPAFRECLAAFEALRRLGFEADDIFFHHTGGVVAICLHAQEREFSISCGSVSGDPQEGWDAACALWQAVSAAEARDAFVRSKVCAIGATLVSGLVMAGVRLPCTVDPSKVS